MPFSRFHSQNPEGLWDWMDGLRQNGIEALAMRIIQMAQTAKCSSCRLGQQPGKRRMGMSESAMRPWWRVRKSKGPRNTSFAV